MRVCIPFSVNWVANFSSKAERPPRKGQAGPIMTNLFTILVCLRLNRRFFQMHFDSLILQ